MNEEQIKQALNQLADYQAQQDTLRLEQEELINKLMPPEIKKAIEDIRAEYAVKSSAAAENIEQLQNEIKAAVKELGASVKSDLLHAVFSSGRTTWDSKGLDGYVVAHPEVEKFKKVGEASVSIRAAK